MIWKFELKKFFSYFFPFTKKIPTQFSGNVELTYFEGNKILNSTHANYSYDSLQRLLKFGLEQTDLNAVKTILLLGLGGGSVIQTLREDFHFTGKITAVEIDAVMIEIAKVEFQIIPDHKLEIVNADANEFVKSINVNYDMVIVDLFIDDHVPVDFYGESFWEQITRLLNKSGSFIFNASTTRDMNSTLLPLLKFLDKFFTIRRYDKIEGTNTIIIGQKL